MNLTQFFEKMSMDFELMWNVLNGLKVILFELFIKMMRFSHENCVENRFFPIYFGTVYLCVYSIKKKKGLRFTHIIYTSTMTDNSTVIGEELVYIDAIDPANEWFSSIYVQK